MAINNKHINIAGRLVLDTFVLVLLLAITALPASTFSLLSYEESPTVLSEQDVRYYIEPLDLQNEDEEELQNVSDENIIIRENN